MFRKLFDTIAGHEKKLSVTGTAIACAMSCLTCSFWQYEGYLSPHVIGFLKGFAAVVMIAVWVYSSFANGLARRVSFAVFTALYWVVPFIVADFADGMTDPRTFNIHVFVAGEYCKLLGIDALCLTPFGKLSREAGCVAFSSLCLVIFLIAMFVGGAKGLPQEQEKHEDMPAQPRKEEVPVFAESADK